MSSKRVSDVFSLAWTKSTLYVTGASGLHGPKRLSYCNWKVGSVSVDIITFFIFDLTFCDLRVVTGKCYIL